MGLRLAAVTISEVLARDFRKHTATAADDQNVPDDEEEGAADPVDEPPGSLAIPGLSGDHAGHETGDDHEDVGDADEDGVSGGKTGEEGEGDQEERSGEEPVDVTWGGQRGSRRKSGVMIDADVGKEKGQGEP